MNYLQPQIMRKLTYRFYLKTMPLLKTSTETQIARKLLRQQFQFLRCYDYLQKIKTAHQNPYPLLSQFYLQKQAVTSSSELIAVVNQAIHNIINVIDILNNSDEQMQQSFIKADTNVESVKKSMMYILECLLAIKFMAIGKKVNKYLVIAAIRGIVDSFRYINLEKMSSPDRVKVILQLQFKLPCCCQLIMQSLHIQPDISSLPEQQNSQFWAAVKFTNAGHEQNISKKLALFKKLLDITTYAVIRSEKHKPQYLKWIIFGLSYPHYFINQHHSFLNSRSFYFNPTIFMAQNIWNLPEKGLIKHIVELTMPRIKNNIRIYVPLDENQIPQNITQPAKNTIQVRILYNKQLKQQKKIEEIIIYMHGGGFVALSSQTQQTITRRWSLEVDMPVFSIDYRMPPEYPYPAAPQDCFKAYKFIVNHIGKYFNIMPKKIILAGDSAGGNLACSLTGLIIKRNILIPYGIYAAYPAVDIRKIFSPSKVHALSDPLLYPSMLLLCLKEYVGDRRQIFDDPIACPILLTEQFVGGEEGDKKFPKKWPKTILHVGKKDPLYDDSVKLAHKLFQRGIPYQLHVYKDLSHGFLNLDFFIKQCKQTISDSVEHLRKLLK